MKTPLPCIGQLTATYGFDSILFMAMIHEIRGKVKRHHYEYSKHAVDQSIIWDISVAELEDAVSSPYTSLTLSCGSTFGSEGET